MYTDKEVQHEIDITKTKVKRGCLFWLVLLLSIPLMLVGAFVYIVFLKETELEKSYSPNGENMIKVVQKGEGFLDTPVRVYYGPHYKVRKDYGTETVKGSSAKHASVSIEWEGNERATVTIYEEGRSGKTLYIMIPEKID